MTIDINNYIINSLQDKEQNSAEMNASDWRKAAAFINQKQDAAATVQTDQLSSMPLSALSQDDSSLPVVQYGTHVPLAASTSNTTVAHEQNPQQEDTY